MDLIDLRYSLALQRIREIPGENAVPPAFVRYFEEGAGWFLMIDEEMRFLSSGEEQSATADMLRMRNRKLYEEILPENYGASFACHDCAAKAFGEDMGPVLSALRYEMRSAIPFAYRLERERVLIRMELFLEVHTAFTIAFSENGQSPETEQLTSIIRQYLADYAEDEMLRHIAGQLTVRDDRVKRLALPESSGPDDYSGEQFIRLLYLTGEYVTENETGCASLVGSLPEEKVDQIAGIITDAYRRGFLNGGKNLAAKKNAAVLFHLGLERIFRKCAADIRRTGLNVILPPEVPTLFHDYHHGMSGYCGADPNPQYFYDHSEDLALFLDENLRAKRLEGLENAYRKLRDRTVLYAGPLVAETFGGRPFSPAPSAAAPRYDKAQKKMCAEYRTRADVLYKEAVISRNRSYTIIAFPLPEIAGSFPAYREIFDAVMDFNSLDYALYEEIQTKMCDVLGTASYAEIKGWNGNRTDLRVRLFTPSDPAAEANFENCTADLNIPVGEVFTTPVLKGTNGILHVTGVHLEGLFFKDLEITFRDGRVRDYSCANFEDEEEGKRYIEENILFHHRDLPMGECAIGTNTAAYAAAAKYSFADRLPILIAEKTGPHFAVGDTCYAGDEDNRTFNPDGKEIVAKENAVSALRKTAPDKAYFGCHTDITIPYSELAEFTAVRENGERIPILKEGRFVLKGTQILNIPLDNMAV